MLLKLGVDISRLSDQCRRVLQTVDIACQDITGAEAVLTSTYDGTHSASSLHYVNRAFDIRRPTAMAPAERLLASLKSRLGADFDVVLEADHVHVEFDPK